MTKIGMVRRVGEKHVSSRSSHPDPKGWPQHPPIFWDLVRARTHIRNNNQMLHGDQTMCEENFTWPTTNADARSVCRS